MTPASPGSSMHHVLVRPLAQPRAALQVYSGTRLHPCQPSARTGIAAGESHERGVHEMQKSFDEVKAFAGRDTRAGPGAAASNGQGIRICSKQSSGSRAATCRKHPAACSCSTSAVAMGLQLSGLRRSSSAWWPVDYVDGFIARATGAAARCGTKRPVPRRRRHGSLALAQPLRQVRCRNLHPLPHQPRDLAKPAERNRGGRKLAQARRALHRE